jgi:hypothetical protein
MQRVSTHTTLYALSTLASNNSQEDVLPLAPVDTDCCLTTEEKERLHEVPLLVSLTNVLSSVDYLNVASMQIDEIQELTQRSPNIMSTLKSLQPGELL